MNSSTTDNYIYKKVVDWSLLTQGFSIKHELQVAFGQIAERYVKKGESKPIKLFMNNKTYEARLENVNFDKKYDGHPDVVRIMYKSNGDLAKAFQSIFSGSFEYIKKQREIIAASGKRSNVKIPEDLREYIAIYSTEYDDTYIVETITSYDISVAKASIAGDTEMVAESKFNYEATDDTATIEEKESLRKIRKLNRKIGDSLKVYYGYRCQICGKLIGEEYDTHVVEAHHIEPFSESLNNDSKNIMIVCPNHHRIIHAEQPAYNSRTFTYTYDNGHTDKLMLTDHYL